MLEIKAKPIGGVSNAIGFMKIAMPIYINGRLSGCEKNVARKSKGLFQNFECFC